MTLRAVTDTEPLYAVRCTGCERRFGWTDSEAFARNRQYCNDWCARNAPVTPAQVRNDMMAMLSAAGRSGPQIAAIFGVSYTQVYKVLRKV